MNELLEKTQIIRIFDGANYHDYPVEWTKDYEDHVVHEMDLDKTGVGKIIRELKEKVRGLEKEAESLDSQLLDKEGFIEELEVSLEDEKRENSALRFQIEKAIEVLS